MIFLGLGPDLGLRLSSIGVLACSNRCTVYYLAVGVLPLRPVRFVHDQQLDVLGGEEAAAREVIAHDLGDRANDDVIAA